MSIKAKTETWPILGSSKTNVKFFFNGVWPFFILIDYKIFLDFILSTKQLSEIEPFEITLTPLQMILYCTSYSKQTLWSEGEKNCLRFSWCLLHCFSGSHFLTNSFASSAYVTFVCKWQLPPPGLSNMAVGDVQTGRIEARLCLFLDAFFHLLLKFFSEPWIGPCLFWKKLCSAVNNLFIKAK